MPADFAVLLLAITAGAGIQAAVGVGFSIVAAPVMMVLLGTATAVPVLLMLNTMVSALATDRQAWLRDKPLIRNAVSGCLAGIVLGLLIYPYLSERTVLSLTAILLLIGVASSLKKQSSPAGRHGFRAISGLSGLATVWAATPGPLMVLGLLASGRTAQEARKLVQPVALAAYGTAFALHCLSDWAAFARAPWLWQFAAAAVLGSLLGRLIGPHLPQAAITLAIRVISIFACAALFRRAYLIG
ncbi:sulfite exporter TauE/SafE family protein [Leisingera sp. D0M16]|uniref:sulfite exporter TauE/SafE family protein n=1 Tax=Leisingera coralii TaxID=3351347 RepID=UPI003B7BCD14